MKLIEADNCIVVPKKINQGVSVAITLHIFYVEYIDRFFHYLSRLDFDFDLYVSVSSHALKKRAIKKFSVLKCNVIEVRVVPNRGRNFAPLFVEFSKILLDYDVFAHLHSKKSLYTGQEQIAWADYLLDSLISPALGSDHISRLLNSSKNQPGILFPMAPPGLPFWANHWLRNSSGGHQLNKLLNLDLPVKGPLAYPVGGMFWARVEALKELLRFDWKYELFDVEQGQTDGTLSHAIERYVSSLVKHNGFRTVAYDPNTALATSNKSYVLNAHISELQNVTDNHLVNVTNLSVDFFDTLAFRNSAFDDVAKMRAASILGMQKGQIRKFIQIRNECEYSCRTQKGVGDVGLDEIATKLSSEVFREFRVSITPDDLVKAEVKAELMTLKPKSRLVSVLKKRALEGRYTTVASDTYYQHRHMVDFLIHIGLNTDYLHLEISSETGLRKDRGDYWRLVASKFAGNPDFLHIGDNYVSDVQNPVDFGLNTLLLPNAKEFAIMHGVHIDDDLESADSVLNNSLLGIFQSQWARPAANLGGYSVDF